MELASAQASQGADECSMRHGSVEDQIDSTDSMDSFASAARTASRSSSPGTGVDISRLSPLPSPGALPWSSQSSSLESGDPYPFPRARPEGWKKESSFDEGNARHQAALLLKQPHAAKAPERDWWCIAMPRTALDLSLIHI